MRNVKHLSEYLETQYIKVIKTTIITPKTSITSSNNLSSKKTKTSNSHSNAKNAVFHTNTREISKTHSPFSLQAQNQKGARR